MEDTIFTMENVKELLLYYADSKNCAVLKDAAMDYIVQNKADAIEKLSFTDAPGNLTKDMLVALIRRERERMGLLVAVMTIILIPFVLVNYARGLTRKVLMLTGQEKCLSLLSRRNQKSTHKKRRSSDQKSCAERCKDSRIVIDCYILLYYSIECPRVMNVK